MTKEELNSLYRYALALTHQSDEAYDLVHESILRSHKKFILNKQPYLKKTIRHLFYDQHRKTSIHQSAIETFSSAEEELSFEKIYLHQNEIHHYLKELHPEEREVLFLLIVEEKTYQEVAKLLDIKIGTLLSQVHRLKKKIMTKKVKK